MNAMIFNPIPKRSWLERRLKPGEFNPYTPAGRQLWRELARLENPPRGQFGLKPRNNNWTIAG